MRNNNNNNNNIKQKKIILTDAKDNKKIELQFDPLVFCRLLFPKYIHNSNINCLNGNYKKCNEKLMYMYKQHLN